MQFLKYFENINEYNIVKQSLNLVYNVIRYWFKDETRKI